MGFKDLKAFNKALLAKQGWHIMQEDSSLLHKVYKAKYFPHGNFLEAGQGHNPSYAWVGNGRSINIWSDQWIPNISPLNYELREAEVSLQTATVFNLIDQQTSLWEVAAAIYKIKLAAGDHADKMIRGDATDGKFSVRSAYRLLTTKGKPQLEGERSSTGRQKKVWTALWQLRRKVLTDPSSPLCLKEPEYVSHALAFCVHLEQCWQTSPLVPFVQSSTRYMRLMEIMTQVIEKGHKEDLELLVMISWSFWYRRNQMVHEGKTPAPTEVIEHAISLLKLYQDMQTIPEKKSYSQLQWKKPPPNGLKLNVDGAIFKEQYRAGVGIILRDTNGDVLLAASKKESMVNDPAEVELLAMLRGLQLVLPLGIEELIIESDSLVMVTQLQQEDESWSVLGNLIKETKMLMAWFKGCTIQHVGRLGNEAAHRLGKFAWHIEDISIWWNSCPDFVHQTVWVDKLVME
ncbi:hypothetical protein I3760_03G188300 [Carya illinoinensis]|uniref:RNase H type-1 domain-containing protein n=1 Tax=Carya illinoinensis TaxID=32201 RepID=A0A922JWH9_CARIL|nr:hypothetical protein I3760_03G188300 [Carya illinoinensis]KAG6722946.1 hypothetical protein I3842_03G186800 [Carya illinoinensis]